MSYHYIAQLTTGSILFTTNTKYELGRWFYDVGKERYFPDCIKLLRASGSKVEEMDQEDVVKRFKEVYKWRKFDD